MKKIVLFAVALVAITFVSCAGGDSTKSTTTTDSISAVVKQEIDSVIPDSVSSDSALVEQEVVEVAE